MNIEPDVVLILLQVLPFLVTLLALHFILFKPMLAYLAARQVATVDVRDETRRILSRAEDAQIRWDTRLAEARTEGATLRARLHTEADAQRTSLLHDARTAADARVSAALAEISAAREAARAELQSAAAALAVDIASTVLDRPVQGPEAP